MARHTSSRITSESARHFSKGPPLSQLTSRRYVAALTSVLVLVALAGCSTPDAPAAQPPSPVVEDTEPVAESSPAATPTPTRPASIPHSSGSFNLETDDGYRAVVNFEWQEPQQVSFLDANLLRANTPAGVLMCGEAALVQAGGGVASGDPELFVFTSIVVQGDISYQVTNGFVWPAEVPVYVSLATADFARPLGVGGLHCGDLQLPGPDSATGDFTAQFLYYSERTPNSPEGTAFTPGEGLSLEVLVNRIYPDGTYVSAF